MSENRFGVRLRAIVEDFARVRGLIRQRMGSEPDGSAATIERLELELEEERARAASLQRTADDLKFRMELLEKGYAKQLEDTRQRTDEAERSLADREAELAAALSDHEAATGSLATTREELQRVTTERDRLRRQIDGDPEPDEAEDGAEADLPEGTINRLLAVASRPRAARKPAGEASPAGDSDEAPVDMLSPDLMLPEKDAGDR